jgi:hypothetical protein
VSREYPLASHDSYSLTGCSWAIGTLGYGPGFAVRIIEELSFQFGNVARRTPLETCLGSNNSKSPLEEVIANSPNQVIYSLRRARCVVSSNSGPICYFLNCTNSFTVVAFCCTSTSPTSNFLRYSAPNHCLNDFGSVPHNSVFYPLGKLRC